MGPRRGHMHQLQANACNTLPRAGPMLGAYPRALGLVISVLGSCKPQLHLPRAGTLPLAWGYVHVPRPWAHSLPCAKNLRRGAHPYSQVLPCLRAPVKCRRRAGRSSFPDGAAPRAGALFLKFGSRARFTTLALPAALSSARIPVAVLAARVRATATSGKALASPPPQCVHY